MTIRGRSLPLGTADLAESGLCNINQSFSGLVRADKYKPNSEFDQASVTDRDFCNSVKTTLASSLQLLFSYHGFTSPLLCWLVVIRPSLARKVAWFWKCRTLPFTTAPWPHFIFPRRLYFANRCVSYFRYQEGVCDCPWQVWKGTFPGLSPLFSLMPYVRVKIASFALQFALIAKSREPKSSWRISSI